MVYVKPAVRTVRDMENMVFDDLRIYEDSVGELDVGKLHELSDVYGSTNVRLLARSRKSMRAELSAGKT